MVSLNIPHRHAFPIIDDDTDIAWAQKSAQLNLVADGSFHFKKLAGAGSFFNWGLIELTADQMKRTKNCRRMHMVFTLQSGTVEAKVNDNEFTVHRGGIWQVPRGKSHFILASLFSCLGFSLAPHLSNIFAHLSCCLHAYHKDCPYPRPQVGISHAPSAYDVAQAPRLPSYRWDQGTRSEAVTYSYSLQFVASPTSACGACCATLDAVYPSQPTASLGNPRPHVVFWAVTCSRSFVARDAYCHWCA